MINAELLRDPDRDTRVDAWRELLAQAQEHQQVAREALRDVIVNYRDYDSEIFTRTLCWVQLLDSPEVREALLSALLEFEELQPLTQSFVGRTCAQLGMPEGEPYLLRLLHHTDRLARLNSAEALGQLGSEEAVPTLAAWLHDPDEYFRQEAEQALARIDTHDAVEALWAAFLTCQFDRAHHVAAALGRLTKSATDGPDLFARLLHAAQNPQPDIRYWAAKALGASGNPAARKTLTALTTDSSKTRSGASVAAGAKQGLKTLDRLTHP